MTLARAKAGSTQTQSLLVPPYHLGVEFRSACCSGPRDLLFKVFSKPDQLDSAKFRPTILRA